MKTIKKIFNKEKFSPYKIPFKELIERCEKRMIVKPKCPFCENPMYFRRSAIVVDVFPIRDDINYKCVYCFHTNHFGIPITREEALKEIELRGGRFLSFPTRRQDERDQIVIRERLKKLGYLE